LHGAVVQVPRGWRRAGRRPAWSATPNLDVPDAQGLATQRRAACTAGLDLTTSSSWNLSEAAKPVNTKSVTTVTSRDLLTIC
jgi:hypothetical protein